MVKSLIKKVIRSITGISKAAPASTPPPPAGEKKLTGAPPPQTEGAEVFRPGQPSSRPRRQGSHPRDERPRRDDRRNREEQPTREDRPRREKARGPEDNTQPAPRSHSRSNSERPRRERRPPQEARTESTLPPPPPRPREDLHAGWSLSQYDIPVEHGKTRFVDMNLHDRLLHAVAELGFKYCTPIQAEVLPYTLTGRDAFGQAQTGTGKTAAFVLATLDHFLRNPSPPGRRVGSPRALVIAPTRELVMQIYNDACDLAKYTDFECAVLFGGMDYEKQQRQLQNKVIDIVCATPGRLLDFKRRGDLNLGSVEVLVLDEADRMLDMGFIPDVREIVHSTPPKQKRQTLFFSATFTDEIKRLATQWTNDPVTVTIEPESVAVDTVDQVVYIVTLQQRFALIHHILSRPDMDRSIIFVNRRYEAEKLADQLHRYGFNCDLLSGAVPQNKRMKTLEMFKEGKISVLVATDVAGRGLHVEGVSHVINFSLPDDPEDYVHRIGRTGRAGATGTSISFATEDDAYNLPEIEKFIGRELKCTHPEDEWLVLPEPPQGIAAPNHRSNSRPPRPNRGGPRPGGRRPPRR